MPFILEPMRYEDIPDVAAIERQSFTTPWPVHAYRRELKDNRNSRYIVVRWLEPENGRDSAHEQGNDSSSPNLPTVQEYPDRGTSGVWQTMSKWLPFLRQEQPEHIALDTARGTIAGYAGIWLILDEAHVTTIAVRPDFRGRGIGELLLVRLIEISQQMGGKRVTLEVRVSNEVAQKLYRKYTFKVEGVRRRYYSDDNEDAHIMWSEEIDSAGFQSRFEELRSILRKRLGAEVEEI